MKQEKMTERQREFARLIAKGEKQGKAYLKAFNCRGQSEAAVRSNASRLAKNDNIRRLIEELIERADGETIAERQEILKRLSKQFRKADEEDDRAGMVKIANEINKMTGGYEPERVEVSEEWTFSRLLKEISEESSL